MSFITVSDLAQAASFRTRITVALVTVAGGLVVDAAENSLPPAQRDKRYALAQSVLRDPTAITSAFVWPILANATIAQKGLATDDGEFVFQIVQIWDVVAGVVPADKVA